MESGGDGSVAFERIDLEKISAADDSLVTHVRYQVLKV
jgi:hypothetical protein